MKLNKSINNLLTILIIIITAITLFIALFTPTFNKELDNMIKEEIKNKIKGEKYFMDKNIKMISNLVNNNFKESENIRIIVKEEIENEKLEKEKQEKEKLDKLEKEKQEKEKQEAMKKAQKKAKKVVKINTYHDGFYYKEIDESIKKRILGKSFPISFKYGYSKISYSDLRYVRVKYVDFNGQIHNDGELIVNKKVAQDIVEIFYKLYEAKYPFTSIKLVDEYNADDQLSMSVNNTSCFNYRLINNTNQLSNHSLGLAIDINPLLNPHVINGTYYPSNATEYVDRDKNFRGKIDENDLSYKLFTSYGWSWGGNFKNSKDYQHFEKKG